MENMFAYIFGTLKSTESAIRDITKSLNNQKIVNKRNTVFAIGVTAWIYISELQRKQEKEILEKKLEAQEKLIVQLGSEVRALKSEKGEAQM